MMNQATIESGVPGGFEELPGTLRKWLSLAAGLALVWVFMFVIAPAFQKYEMVKPMAEYVRNSGIEASALYYTGVEETGEAEAYLRDAFTYAPAGP